MSKAKQNAFLTGYFTVLALGTAGLGYLAWSSWSASSTAAETYETTRKKLETLQKAPVFPNTANVEAKKKQVDAYAEKVRGLNNKLREYQTPLVESTDNSAFQKLLQTERDGIASDAKNSGVKLPENFDLGMGTYLNNFPQSAAVPRLTYWLQGISWVTKALVASGVKEIVQVSRQELPFEKGAPKEEEPKGKTPPKKPAASAAKGKPGDKAAGPPPPVIAESAVIERNPFTVSFIASNRELNEVLNKLANTSPSDQSPFFFNIRVLRIENEKKEGQDVSTQITVQEETEEGSDKPFKRDSAFIFGNEKIHVHMTLDLLRFPEAVAAADAKK